MAMPEIVQVAGMHYRIRTDDGERLQGLKLWGQTNHHKLEIYLREDIIPEQCRAILLHEIVHCIEGVYQINLEESQLNLIATGLFEVIVSNPEVFRFIKGD